MRTTVTSPPGAVAEALEACAILEHALVSRAARRRTEADLAALARSLRSLAAAGDDVDAFVARDRALRTRIGESSRSRHLARAAAAIHRSLAGEHAHAARHAIAEGSVELMVAARVSLVGAIAAQDGPAAAGALDRMLGELQAADW